MLKITFRDRFSYIFHTDILYAFRVRIPSMIDKGSTDTNQRFQILTRRPFRKGPFLFETLWRYLILVWHGPTFFGYITCISLYVLI